MSIDFQHRLDVMARAGLPLWITEFDMRNRIHDTRAEAIEDAMHVYFSHPAVEGILMWGFWNKSLGLGDKFASLVDGDDFEVSRTHTRL